MLKERIELYRRLEVEREAKVVVCVTSDRRGLETPLEASVLDLLADHLRGIRKVEKICFYLSTHAGEPRVAWEIVNLIRQFCDELEVVLPSQCHAAGTLICLGADSIIMTKQSTLAPIDLTVIGPLSPQVPGAKPNARAPASWSSISGFVEFGKRHLGITAFPEWSQLLEKLMSQVHPLILGEVFRNRCQIQMLAERLLSSRINRSGDVEKIISFLCGESGQHELKLYRRHARDELRLPVVAPKEDLDTLIHEINVSTLNQLSTPDDSTLLDSKQEQPYGICRALLESVAHGGHSLVRRIKDGEEVEGWVHRKVVRGE